MPSSPASSVKSAAPTTTAARWAAGAGSWPRLLALQILQVTSLSITFSLAYDFSAIPLNGTPLGSPRLAGSLHDFHAPEPSSAGPAGSVKWARKKKARAASAKLPPHQLSQASAGGQASDTDLEDPDDGLDGEEEEAIERSVPSVAARGGHVHYPLYQRGSELLGSSPVDLGESSAGPSCSGSRPHFATLLSKGLAVTVNGSPWRSVAAHVIEGEDEAVVVIYGLGCVHSPSLACSRPRDFPASRVGFSAQTRADPDVPLPAPGGSTWSSSAWSAMKTDASPTSRLVRLLFLTGPSNDRSVTHSVVHCFRCLDKRSDVSNQFLLDVSAELGDYLWRRCRRSLSSVDRCGLAGRNLGCPLALASQLTPVEIAGKLVIQQCQWPPRARHGSGSGFVCNSRRRFGRRSRPRSRPSATDTRLANSQSP